MAGKRSNGEGTLRKRPNGLWECTMMVGYKDDGTRRYKSFYGKSQKEAKDKAETYKRDIAAGLYIDPNLTFREWAQKWYDGYQDSVSPTTYESYGYTLKILIGAFGQRKLNTIKALDVEDFLKKLRTDGKSDSYLTKCRGMLYQIMHKAEANDLIHKNPVRFAEKMKAKGPVKRKEAFTQEEVQILMEQLPQDRTGHTVRLMLATGMRTQEVLALEPQHIEPDVYYPKRDFLGTAEPQHLRDKSRRPAPAPCFFMHPGGPTVTAQKSHVRRHQSDSNSHGDQLSSLRRQSAENCEGAKPTSSPALRPAADNRPAVSRGGPPSRRHHTTPPCSTTKNCLRVPLRYSKINNHNS